MDKKWSENPKRSDHVVDVGVDGKMILKIHINRHFLGGFEPDDWAQERYRTELPWAQWWWACLD